MNNWVVVKGGLYLVKLEEHSDSWLADLKKARRMEKWHAELHAYALEGTAVEVKVAS